MLMKGTLAYYEKTCCLLVIDRDSQSYEVTITKLGGSLQSPTTRLASAFLDISRSPQSPSVLFPEAISNGDGIRDSW